ncbi:MAG: TIGR02757 family protein [Candidatus Eisenbacteria sp.]|nr:TIGR02757 family protein [Candidatus Eisenbacteria bacterium]
MRNRLNDLYARYNRREFVHPDPIEFLYRYENSLDREIAGLVASSLAFGRVAQIHRSVSRVLDRMEEPAAFVRETPPRSIRKIFAGFRHRYATGMEMAELLLGIRRAVREHGSLRACFVSGIGEEDETVLPGLNALAENLVGDSGGECNSLLPLPRRGSACKRLNLYLRWMVRHDEVDPGGWDEVPPSRLIIPLDIHMYRAGLELGFTRRKSADLKTALEVTEGFRRICLEDPVRYDFAITRSAIGQTRVSGLEHHAGEPGGSEQEDQDERKNRSGDDRRRTTDAIGR